MRYKLLFLIFLMTKSRKYQHKNEIRSRGVIPTFYAVSLNAKAVITGDFKAQVGLVHVRPRCGFRWWWCFFF